MKISELRNVKVSVDRVDDAGKAAYRMTIQDPHTREVIWLGFTQEVADGLVAQLTGIQVASRIPIL